METNMGILPAAYKSKVTDRLYRRLGKTSFYMIASEFDKYYPIPIWVFLDSIDSWEAIY